MTQYRKANINKKRHPRLDAFPAKTNAYAMKRA
jgi:hypothetical protein